MKTKGGIRRTHLHHFAIGLIGFLLIINLYLLPTREQTPRATDVIGLILSVIMLIHILRHGISRSYIISTLIIVTSPLIWLGYSIFEGYNETLVESARWLLAIPWGFTLLLIMKDGRKEKVFLTGVFVGILFNVGILTLQYFDYINLLQSIGLTSQDFVQSRIYGRLRVPGLEGHANAGAAVVSIIIPVTIYLFIKYRTHPISFFIAVGAVALASHFSSTRSALLVSVISLATFFILKIRIKRVFRVALMLAVIGSIFLILIGPPGGWIRWSDERYFESNVNERLSSNFSALAMIGSNPLGVGVETGRRTILEAVGIGSYHNAFIQVAAVLGIGQSIIVVLGLGVSAIRYLFRKTRRITAAEILGLHMFGLFMFEEHIKTPTLLILTVWIVTNIVQKIIKSLIGSTKQRADQFGTSRSS